MKKLLRTLGPMIVLLVCIAIAIFLIKSAPEAKRRVHKPVVPIVEVFEVNPVDYQIVVESQGTVMPHTQSTLVSEVAGRVVEATANFHNGSFFALDEVLIGIDPAEYQLALANVEAALAGVTARLAELATTTENLKKSGEIEEQHLALAERQFRRHSKLRKQGTVAQSVLEQSEREYLLRRASQQNLQNSLQLIPTQRRVLEAELKLKETQRETAALNLARTQVLAPYAGRVLEKRVDIGQSVIKGTVLATLYATDAIEVRLPITDKKAQFLSVIEGEQKRSLPVTLFANLAGQLQQWQGRIVRSEGAIDPRTRQQFLVAQVETPQTNSPSSYALKIGQFVEAKIPGERLSNVFVLPRKALRAGDEVLVIGADNKIERRLLKPIWGDKESVVVRDGLTAGERISLTSLPYAPEGAQVKVGGSAEPTGAL